MLESAMRACLLGLLLCLPARAQTDARRFQIQAAKLAADLNSGKFPAIEADFSAALRTDLPPAKAEPFFRSLLGQWGKVVQLSYPALRSESTAVMILHCEEGTLFMTMILDPEGKISGLRLDPHPSDQPVPARNDVPLALPFKARWLVFWGGDTAELNRHNGSLNQRFAFDFVAVDDQDRDHGGKGRKNGDYFAYGREVLAPGDGVVVHVIDGIPDNVPGVMNPDHVLGNAVFIQHGDSAVSVLAHLQPGSIKVRLGQKASRGMVLGLCGNSGNSSQPHLHYHLQNVPVFMDGAGIKIYFARVKLGEKLKLDYSPVKGDVLSQP